MSKQNIISLLQEDKFISPPASLTLVKSMLLMTDVLALQTIENMENCSSAVEPLNLLNSAHEITLKEVSIQFLKHLQIVTMFLVTLLIIYLKGYSH